MRRRRATETQPRASACRHYPAPRTAALLLAGALVLATAPARAAVAAAAAGAHSGDLAALLQRHGIRPVDPPSPATDFRLPRLDGGEQALSALGGRWVILTFFATWCGPCRSEMPTLERLHRDRGGEGLAVVGVSIDSSRAPVKPFVDQMGITFEVLWDESGGAARAYGASSIPLTYLINPAGDVVGVSRGARDWSALGGMIGEALAIYPPGAAAAGGDYAVADSTVPLPPGITPPTATVALSEASPRVGEPFQLAVRILWAGNFDDYQLHPPDVHLPEGVEQEGMTADTSSSEGRNVVTYRVALRATAPGSFALDPVELRYTPRQEAEPVASRMPGPTVEVLPTTVAGLPPRTAAAGAAGLLAVGLLAFVAVRFRRRRGAAAGDEAGERWGRLRGAFEAARGRRLAGDPRGALLALAALAEELGIEEGGERERLAGLVEGARYGGVAPAEELDRLERWTERRLGELAPDPAAEERRALRLRGADAAGTGAAR
jgi:peroxiredoxin